MERLHPPMHAFPDEAEERANLLRKPANVLTSSECRQITCAREERQILLEEPEEVLCGLPGEPGGCIACGGVCCGACRSSRSSTQIDSRELTGVVIGGVRSVESEWTKARLRALAGSAGALLLIAAACIFALDREPLLGVEVLRGHARGGTQADSSPRSASSVRGRQQHGLVALYAGCRNAQPGDGCWEEIQQVMHVTIWEHPEWYPGIDRSQNPTAQDYQDVISQQSPEKCPRPCWTVVPPSNITCEAPLVLFDSRCRTATPGGDDQKCYSRIDWARQIGIHDHPEWYPGLFADSSVEDFQAREHAVAPNECPPPCRGTVEGGSCVCPPPLVQSGLDRDHRPRCIDPPEEQPMTFYMYRALGDKDVPLENTNAADLAGILWYLHHEVVPYPSRRKHITRIVRDKVTMQNTAKLFKEFRKQFGPYAIFSSEQCATVGCDDMWRALGFVVGCQTLNQHVSMQDEIHRAAEVRSGGNRQEATFVRRAKKRRLTWWPWPMPYAEREHHSPSSKSTEYALVEGESGANATKERSAEGKIPIATTRKTTTPGATTTVTTTVPTHGYGPGAWFSLPGPCPGALPIFKHDSCRASMPGGRCPGTTWDGVCTYQVEPAGDVLLDEFVGIGDYRHFVEAGNVEYDLRTDAGDGLEFWNGLTSGQGCSQRMRRLAQIFAEKFPQLPKSLPTPPCNI